MFRLVFGIERQLRLPALGSNPTALNVTYAVADRLPVQVAQAVLIRYGLIEA
jgi:hypothetical protein